ncbi:non-ribosomal peptide synthetase [Streptomyces anulatus]|uniref:Amino acid adenylation domain-containing protein n=6 Tax=Streptomyces TaxID=1883 RepID=A0A7K3RDP9_STRAQ|nr:amino acid adenylation domain-containing protein [Streptomyces anulatus]NED27391.1 amino acid adenylation domain-containing protein [Streptomyces anulatus]
MTSTEDRTEISPEEQRRELTRLLLAEAGLAPPDSPAAPAASVPGGDTATSAPAPLTAAEKRMWFLRHLRPDDIAYNLCGGIRLTGALDPAALTTAVTGLVAAHDILRTRYPTGGDGTPVREILPPGDPVALDPTDLGALPDDERAPAAERVIEQEGRKAFRLADETPLRLRLFRFTPTDHLLVLTVHHIAFDDHSWGRVLDELAARYAVASGADGAIPARPSVQYSDFARWEERQLDGGAWDRQLDYWRQRLDRRPASLALPADRPRAEGPPARGGGTDGVRSDALLDAGTGRALRELARTGGTTLYTALLAAYQAVLHRWSGESDIVVGSPVVNRGRTEFEDVVGNFGNTVILRTDLTGAETFRALVARTRDTCADAFAHQDIPFERVVEALRPADAVGEAPLFDVVFSFVTEESRRVTTPTVSFAEQPHHNGTARFPLVLEARESADGLAFGLTGRVDLFSRAALDRMLGHLLTFLRDAVARPEVPLGSLRILTEDEERTALTQWSRSYDDPAENRPLHRLVADQAARTPDLVAVVASSGTLTYRELDRQADELAQRLRAKGVGPESIVGIHLTRTPGLVVALLAVLKAGGAFMPLEPDWPALRLRSVVESSRPLMVLTDGRHTVAPPPLEVPVLDLAQPSAPVGTPAAPGVEPAMENVAYVIHTSGSTGTPKGVMIRHQSISNRLVWQSGLLGMTSEDRVLHKAPMGFDISVNEIFLPLVNGARLVLADPGGHGDVAHLAELIERERITFLYIVASMLEVLLERDDISDAARSIRHLWCGGEALTPALYRRFRERLDATMYHGYGPAETTIGISCQVFDEDEDGAVITLGTPNPNARLYVLDPAQRPVPVGVVGEIHIGGMPLARGYLNDPVRTAQAFVPDPFGTEPGARLYRTGDLARYRGDGRVDFLGRADHQVKVRGFRIELGEVEATITGHPAVRQAVATVRSGEPGGDRLVAWCVPEGDVTGTDVRDWLAARLPHYAVPGELRLLPALPLTAAGKVDRAALLALEPAPAPAVAVVGPKTDLEREIADVWAELLGRTDIGTRRNFFDVGGHSLLLVRAQTLYRRRLGKDIPLVELYDNPTVAALAAHLSRAPGGGDPELERVRAKARRGRQRAGRGPAGTVGTPEAPGERTR